MPWLAAIGAFVAEYLPGMILRLMVALGISSITYVGVGALFILSQTQVEGWLSAVPAEMASYLAILKVDRAIRIVFSAWYTAMSIRGFDRTAGSLTKPKLTLPTEVPH
jgi:hypothetical protein